MAAAPAEQGRLRSVLSGVGWFVGGVTGGSASPRFQRSSSRQNASAEASHARSCPIRRAAEATSAALSAITSGQPSACGV